MVWHNVAHCVAQCGTEWQNVVHSGRSTMWYGTMWHTAWHTMVHSGGGMVRPQRAICYSATALCSLIYSHSNLCIPRQSGVPGALHHQAGSSCQSQSQSSSNSARFRRLSCKSLLLPQSRCQSTLSTLFYQHSRHQTANSIKGWDIIWNPEGPKNFLPAIFNWGLPHIRERFKVKCSIGKVSAQFPLLAILECNWPALPSLLRLVKYCSVLTAS